MEIRKRIVPKNSKGLPIPYAEGEYIFFDVEYNSFRDVSTASTADVRDRYESASCECVLCLPESYTDGGEKTQLVLFCHGAGGRVSAEDERVGGLAEVIGLLSHGFALLDVNGSIPSGLSMGSPEHIQALYKAYRYAIKHYNLTERVLVGGASMGGITSMNFLNTYPSLVLAAGLYYPRLNIDGVTVGEHYCIGTWDKVAKRPEGMSTRDLIKQNYHLEGDEWCEDNNTVGFNPYRTRSFINREGERVVIPPCPIKIWQGNADAVVDPVMTEEFVRSVRRGGCYIELHTLEGVEHVTTPTMREELALWFERFV